MTGRVDPDRASRVCLALIRVGTRLAFSFDQGFAAQRLTQAQFRLLIAVANLTDTPRATPSGVADALFIERATVSGLLKRLIARRLLTRHRAGDGRSYRVALTAAGWATLQRNKPHAIAAANDAMRGVTRAELAALERHLEKIERHLRSIT
ncbi:MAG: MarR family transcriptional regulator [Gemmatimonadaceae bacterium]|nr:MarR family transcriptional regulator [Gemmatimonadaceae bacterium]